MQDTTYELRRLVSTISGISQDHAQGLQKLGIETVADVIKHLPLRFEEHHGGVTIEEATAILGENDRNPDLVTIEGEIAEIRPIRGWKRAKARVEVFLEDELVQSTVDCKEGTSRHADPSPWIALDVQGQRANDEPTVGRS